MPRESDPRVRQVVARNLKKLLGDSDIATVATRLQMDVTQLRGYLGAHRGLSFETLMKIAARLPCALDDLVYGVDAQYTKGIVRRRHDTIESQISDDLADVIAGYGVIVVENPGEAKWIAGEMRHRLLSSAGIREPDAPTDEASAAAVEEAIESPAPSQPSRRRRQGQR